MSQSHIADMREGNHTGLRGSGMFVLFAAIAAGGMWVLFAASFSPHELLVGLAVLIVSVSFGLFMWSFRPVDVHLRWRDIAEGWRLPWYLAVDCWTILVVLINDIFGRQSPGSFFRVCHFDPAVSGTSDATAMGRRFLATAYTTATPNSIVLGVDRHRMLFHQVARTPVERMTRKLGARG